MGGLRPNYYLKPQTPAEVTSILRQYKEHALVIGGGTEIYELSERGFLTDIKALIDLSKLGLNKIRTHDGEVSLGASVTLSQLESQKDLYRDGTLGCLPDALHDLGPPQVRNVATVGGAVTACIPFFDLPTALASLDSAVEVNGEGSSRRIPILSFQKDYLQPDLNEGEFVTRILVPRQDKGTRSAFVKFVANAGDWSLVNCSCAVRVSAGRVAAARLVFGAVSNKPFSAEKTASTLVGKELTEETLDSAADALEKELVDPTSDGKASGNYRRRLAKILLRETVKRAASRETR